MISLTSSSLSTLTSPLSSPTPRRIRFRPPRASCTTTTTTTATSYKTKSFTNLSPHRRMASCLYEILGIPVGATDQEIKTAYRRLARVSHPDVAAINRKDSSADEFMKIHAAYCTLSDPQKRAVYDSKLFRRNQPLTAMSSGFRGYSGRNWETDQCW